MWKSLNCLHNVYWYCYVRHRRSFSYQFTLFIEYIHSLHHIWTLLLQTCYIKYFVYTDTVTWDIGEVSVVTIFINMLIFLFVFGSKYVKSLNCLHNVYWYCYVRHRRSFSYQFTLFIEHIHSLHHILTLLLYKNHTQYLVCTDAVTWEIGEVSVLSLHNSSSNFIH